MEDYIALTQTAVLAKEKGFDEYYRKSVEPKTGDVWINGAIGKNSELDRYNRICFPSQSVLQSWLRETHNIHIEITTDNFSDWSVALNVKDDTENTGYWTYDHNSYEEALENGLQRALDLIQS